MGYASRTFKIQKSSRPIFEGEPYDEIKGQSCFGHGREVAALVEEYVTVSREIMRMWSSMT